jgi:hypothetical protein
MARDVPKNRDYATRTIFEIKVLTRPLFQAIHEISNPICSQQLMIPSV